MSSRRKSRPRNHLLASLALSLGLLGLVTFLRPAGGAGTAAQPAPATSPAAAAASLAASPRNSPWTGDFDALVKRRALRILTPYSRTNYFVDRGQPRGIIADVAAQLETHLNTKLKTGVANKVHVVVVPTSRNELLTALDAGRGDIIAAGITVTPERARLADFTQPLMRNVNQIVVRGPGAPPVATVDDLAGKEVAVRAGSIQEDSLKALNERFAKEGKPAVRIRQVPPLLEDEDILEMANAGLLELVVVDQHYAEFWAQIFTDIAPVPAAVVRQGSDIAWAVRKNSPQLIGQLNAFLAANGKGTLFGNTVLKKYLKDTRPVRNATSAAEIAKFRQLVEIFRKYSQQYSVDYLLMLAQGYQESRLDQTVRSPVGAIGVMQVMPATGKELAVGDITQVDPNVQAGVKYMRFMMDQYFKDDPMTDLNKALMTFASYNAGPNRIRRLREKAKAQGLDPNVWFNNVERVVAAEIGRETVTYVANIYKYYVAYTLVVEEMNEKKGARAAQSNGG